MPSERSLQATPTWVMAVLCFVLVVVSIIIEQTIHFIGSWLKKKRKPALVEALEKIKAELMLLGFISLILTVVQGPISRICIPRSAANSLHPCSRSEEDIEEEDYEDPCISEGKVQFVSEYGIHQLHVFIFVLALSHVIYCVMTLGLGRLKMRKWKVWEDETKTIEYQFSNDPERFRFARDTSFGRRHMSYWSKSPVLLWIVCFFRQFVTSVTKVDYLTLRHGFITAHLAPQSHTVFDFQKYINRSLEDDFKVVVGISPILWLLAVFFLLSNAHGWNSSLWLPFIPLIVLLLVGTKLQVIITKMGTRIQERGDVVKGTLVVQPGDDLFWFNRPGLILFLIHFVLFQNAFLLAFFAWSWYEYGLRSCFHRHLQDIIIRISMGVIIQFLCSYVILPLYALVTQMGSTMRSTVFSDKVAMALRSWHHTAKKHTRQGRHQLETTTPFSSRPTTPLHGARLSPVHLLHNYQTHTIDSLHTSPRTSNFDNEGWGVNPSPNASNHPVEDYAGEGKQDGRSQQSRSAEPPWVHGQHEIEIAVTNLSFREK